jgi:hypothetical protein
MAKLKEKYRFSTIKHQAAQRPLFSIDAGLTIGYLADQ